MMAQPEVSRGSANWTLKAEAAAFEKHAAFAGRLVMVGFGGVGQGVLPLLLRHIDGLGPKRITVVTGCDRGRELAAQYGISFHVEPLTEDNFRAVLQPLLGPGDFLLNLSVSVGSLAIIQLAQEVGAMYCDTSLESFVNVNDDPSRNSLALRTIYTSIQEANKMREQLPKDNPTAVMLHGANPGLVSHFTKQALLNIARDCGMDVAVPADRAGWAKLMMQLGVKVVHVAECDTSKLNIEKRPGEFISTWSVHGMMSEFRQPAELGWGTHERHFPRDGFRHSDGLRSSIYLAKAGADTWCRSWTPLGPYRGMVVSHGESITLSDYFTVFGEDGSVVFRPTVHYVYHPCDAAILSLDEWAAREWAEPEATRVAVEEVISGVDELGVLLAGHPKGAYWYGSTLGQEEAARLCPHNNATTLQVAAGVLGAMVWQLENPRRGLVHCEELDFQRVMQVATPYLGPMVGAYSDWTPLKHRESLFPEQLDAEDPWQFANLRV